MPRLVSTIRKIAAGHTKRIRKYQARYLDSVLNPSSSREAVLETTQPAKIEVSKATIGSRNFAVSVSVKSKKV